MRKFPIKLRRLSWTDSTEYIHTIVNVITRESEVTIGLLLFEKMKAIYSESPYLEGINPLSETYLLFRLFLVDQISNSIKFLEPGSYSSKYKKDDMETLNLFLSLSKNDELLIKNYSIECEKCRGLTISESLSSVHECANCQADLGISGADLANRLSNIYYVFEINVELLEKLKRDIRGSRLMVFED